VYSVLLMAATSARPVAGLVTMLAFGAGTLPAMLLTGLGAARLAQVVRRRGTRLGLGLLVVGLGIATIAMPVSGWLAVAPHHHG
jgi:sulfite exporter TauE/SafE